MLNLFLSVLATYLIAGFIFSIVFVSYGAGRIDPAASEGSIGFRLLIFPGCVALWPVLAQRSYRAGRKGKASKREFP